MASAPCCQQTLQSPGNLLAACYSSSSYRGARRVGVGSTANMPCCLSSKGMLSNGTMLVSTRCSLSEDNTPGKNPQNMNERLRSRLDALYYTRTDDTAVPVESSSEHARLTLSLEASEKSQDLPPCPECEAAGQVQCGTCKGSGLYVEPILESQGIIKMVKCLGCGGGGIIMCLNCGGWGHMKTFKAKEGSAAS